MFIESWCAVQDQGGPGLFGFVVELALDGAVGIEGWGGEKVQRRGDGESGLRIGCGDQLAIHEDEGCVGKEMSGDGNGVAGAVAVEG